MELLGLGGTISRSDERLLSLLWVFSLLVVPMASSSAGEDERRVKEVNYALHIVTVAIPVVS